MMVVSHLFFGFCADDNVATFHEETVDRMLTHGNVLLLVFLDYASN